MADPGIRVPVVTGMTLDSARAILHEADLGLGCGAPVGHLALQPGETVLDLGSGPGLDALLAARQVGPTGRVIGVDMTPEMLARWLGAWVPADVADRLATRAVGDGPGAAGAAHAAWCLERLAAAGDAEIDGAALLRAAPAVADIEVATDAAASATLSAAASQVAATQPAAEPGAG